MSETPDRNTPAAAPDSTKTTSDGPISERVNNRSQRPSSAAFRAFMSSQWAPDASQLPEKATVADYAAARRRKLSEQFPGERLVIPAGPLKVRSNDTDYLFRPHSAFAHLTGLGADHEPDAVLILEPVDPGRGDDDSGHQGTLYFRPSAGRDTEEFYANARYGEFWIGKRPSPAELQATLNLRTADLSELEAALTKGLGDPAAGGTQVRMVRGVDSAVEGMLDAARASLAANVAASGAVEASGQEASKQQSFDDQLMETLSELRLVKDSWEVSELRSAVDATIDGFAEAVRALPRAVAHPRGERVVEGAFAAQAREAGNGLGYETIAASGDHATTLHWITNNGSVQEGDLFLLDAGVEVDSLYTADLTRTIPVSGKFSTVQHRIYQAVLDAADAAFAVAKPGAKFRDVHQAAMVVLAQRLADWGLLPVSAEESLSPEGQQHRRWMPHGTSHHLGLDVHDCAQARSELYLDGVLEPGMVFTIEPGLYFKANDLAVPEEYRGIGIRIEDDVLITETGNENLSAALPRTPEDIEAWLLSLRDSQ